jgi:hypothetical protein
MAVKNLSNAAGVLFDERRDFYPSPAKVSELYKTVAPYLTLLNRKGRESVQDPDYKLFQHSSGFNSQYMYLNDATPTAWTSNGEPGDTVVQTVDNVTNLGGAGDHLKGLQFDVFASSYSDYKGTVFVTSVSGNDVTFKSLGNPTDLTNNRCDAMADDDIFRRRGSAFGEGTVGPDAFHDEIEVVYNSAQIFKTAIEVTGTLKATTNLRGYSSEVARLRREKTLEFAKQIDDALMFGVRSGGIGAGQGTESFATHQTDGTNVVRTTMGVVRIMERYGTTSGDEQNSFTWTKATADWDTVLSALQKLFRIRPSTGRKMAYCGSGFLVWINQVGSNGFLGNTSVTINLNGSAIENRFGLSVQELSTPFGTLEMVWSPGMDDGFYNEHAIIVDVENCGIKQFRPDTFMANVKTEDAYDGYKDVWQADLGLWLTNVAAHGMVKLA